MTGNRAGGLKATEINKASDPDFYKKLGSMGGKASSGPDYRKGGRKPTGFAHPNANPKLAGAKGGAAGRRSGPSKAKLAQLAANEEPTIQPIKAML